MREVTSMSSSIACERVVCWACFWSWPLKTSEVINWDLLRSWCTGHHGFCCTHLVVTASIYVFLIFSLCMQTTQHPVTRLILQSCHWREKTMLCARHSPVRAIVLWFSTTVWFYQLLQSLTCPRVDVDRNVQVSVHKSCPEKVASHQYTRFLETCLSTRLHWPGPLFNPTRGVQKLNDDIPVQGWALPVQNTSSLWHWR